MVDLSNMKIGSRLGVGFGALTVLLLLLAATGWWGIATVNQNMDLSMAEAKKMSLIKDIGTSLDTLYLEMWGLVTAKDASSKSAHKAEIEKIRTEYLKQVGELKDATKSPEVRALIAGLEDALSGAQELNRSITEKVLRAEGQDAASLERFESEGGRHMQEKIDPAVEKLVREQEKRLEAADDAAELAYSRALWVLAIGAMVALGLAVVLGVTIRRSIVVPIQECVGLTGLLAQGDFSREVPEAFRQRRDEMGDLARAFHAMVGNTRDLLKSLTGGVQTLAASSTEMSAISSQMSGNVKGTSAKAGTVAAAAEEMSANTTSVAAGVEEAATNLASVAAATEEMSSTIGEIATNAERARSISSEATQQALAVSETMRTLGTSAQEIGQVTETINSISSQTNLLALNATIEAARAGAAGKGFAVVANEIKELAQQTAKATEEIKAKISGIQGSTGVAVADIGKISGVIKDVGELVASIATGIEEQAAVTKDVARNIAQASTGVRDANERVAQTATVTRDVAKDITAINVAAGEMSDASHEVQRSAAELSKLAEQLKVMVGRFKM